MRFNFRRRLRIQTVKTIEIQNDIRCGDDIFGSAGKGPAFQIAGVVSGPRFPLQIFRLARPLRPSILPP